MENIKKTFVNLENELGGLDNLYLNDILKSDGVKDRSISKTILTVLEKYIVYPIPNLRYISDLEYAKLIVYTIKCSDINNAGKSKNNIAILDNNPNSPDGEHIKSLMESWFEHVK